MTVSNVVAFRPKPKPPAPLPITAPDAVLYMVGEIQQWAHDNNVDTESMDFKYEGATIMAVLQGMLYRASK